jgi:hypothetical protein
MTIWELFICTFYLVTVLLGAVRMRRLGVRFFDLLAFAVNTGAIAWLLFLYISFRSDEHAARLLAPHDSWIPWCCLLLAVLLIPTTIRGMVRAVLATQQEGPAISPKEQAAAIQALTTQNARTTVTLVIGTFWLVFLSVRTFGYFLSHFWQIFFGVGASAGFGWIVVLLIKRWQQHGATS